MDSQYKCGYCHYLINTQCADYLQHECFGQFDQDIHELVSSDANVLTIVAKITQVPVPLLSNTEATSLEELLIKAVQDRPQLYNNRLPLSQRTILKKNELWAEIKNNLALDITVDELKAKWKYLRDCYTKSKKKVKQYIPSGSAAVIREPGFRYFQLMTFLDDSTERESTISSIPDESVTSPSATPSPSISPTPSTSQEKTKKRKREETSELEKQVIKSLMAPETDGVDGYLQRMGESLRKFPYRDRCRLEIDIMQLIFERQCELNIE